MVAAVRRVSILAIASCASALVMVKVVPDHGPISGKTRVDIHVRTTPAERQLLMDDAECIFDSEKFATPVEQYTPPGVKVTEDGKDWITVDEIVTCETPRHVDGKVNLFLWLNQSVVAGDINHPPLFFTFVDETSVEEKTVQTIKKEGSYLVRKGDSLNSVAAKYDITTSELKAWNNMTKNIIVVGQKLRLPSFILDAELVNSRAESNPDRLDMPHLAQKLAARNAAKAAKAITLATPVQEQEESELEASAMSSMGDDGPAIPDSPSLDSDTTEQVDDEE